MSVRSFVDYSPKLRECVYFFCVFFFHVGKDSLGDSSAFLRAHLGDSSAFLRAHVAYVFNMEIFQDYFWLMFFIWNFFRNFFLHVNVVCVFYIDLFLGTRVLGSSV